MVPVVKICVALLKIDINPLNAKLNPICHLLTLLGAHPILHVSRIRVKLVPIISAVGKASFSHIQAFRIWNFRHG
jgi:hypothetical protein